MNPASKRIRLALYLFGIRWGLVLVVPFFWLAMLSGQTHLDALALPPTPLFAPPVPPSVQVLTPRRVGGGVTAFEAVRHVKVGLSCFLPADLWPGSFADLQRMPGHFFEPKRTKP